MNIKISPRENSSITKEIEFELGKYTIFAGENNAGKTNVMKALKDLLPEERVIYIPAESIQVDNHVKTSSQTDPMRAAFLKLVDVTIGELPNVNYEIVEGFLSKISRTFDSFGVPNIKLELGVKKLSESDVKKVIKEEVSKKILNSVVKDNYGSGCDIEIDKVGQGTQRLIIAAIVQELSKVKAPSEELFLLFEEPEIYLHPKLKRNLYNALSEIAENHNIKVVITTHDPYFIELGSEQLIYKVFRDIDGATTITKSINGVLSTPTYAEVNYVVFGVPSTDYLLQLCQQAEENKLTFKDELIDSVKIFEIRGALAHKTSSMGRSGKLQPHITEDIKNKTIEHLRNILS